MAKKAKVKSKGPAWPKSRITHQKKPSETPTATDEVVSEVMDKLDKELHQPQAEEPQADMVGAVAEEAKFVPFAENAEGQTVCIICQAVQMFRGDYEKSQVIANGFTGWKCVNPSCPTRKVPRET